MISNEIEPFGDERSDMRAAVNTTRLVAALIDEISEDQIADEIDNLQNYLAIDIPENDVLFPEQAAALKKS